MQMLFMKNTLSMFAFVLAVVLFAIPAHAQHNVTSKPNNSPGDKKIGIYFSNPISLLSKGRIKIEWRIDQSDALQLSLAGYYAIFPGSQESLEYRRYFRSPGVKSENFIYGKAGLGYNSTFQVNLFSNGPDYDPNNPGNYYLAGAGVGRHFNFGAKEHFFLDLAAGFKYCGTSGHAAQLFYITGPGSTVDIHFHFGWQF
jgi:hypothetical protein